MANVTLNVTDNNGKEAGTLEAPEALFGFTAEEVQAHVPLIHQVVVAQRAAPSPVVAASRGSRRAPVALVRAQSALLSGTTAVSHTARCRVTTASAPPRK